MPKRRGSAGVVTVAWNKVDPKPASGARLLQVTVFPTTLVAGGSVHIGVRGAGTVKTTSMLSLGHMARSVMLMNRGVVKPGRAGAALSDGVRSVIVSVASHPVVMAKSQLFRVVVKAV